MLIVLVLTSALCMALHLVLLSREMRRNSAYSPVVAMVLTHAASGVLLGIAWLGTRPAHAPEFDPVFTQYLLISVLATLLAKWLYFYAYSRIEVAQVSVFSALTLPLAVLSGWWLLGEVPTMMSLAGIAVVFFGIYALFLPPLRGQPWMVTIFSPFRHVVGRLPVMCAMLSAFPPAVSIIFQKKSVMLVDPLSYAVLASLLLAMCAALLLRPGTGGQTLKARVCVINPVVLMAQVLPLAAAQYLSSAALLHGAAANVMSLLRVGIVFQIILAYLLLHQKTRMYYKLAISFFVVLGGAMIIAGER